MEGTSGRVCPSPPCRHAPSCSSLVEAKVRARLMSYAPRLAEYLHLDERFYNLLTSYRIISKHEKERILGHDQSSEVQVHKLLDLLLRKSWSHIRAFCRLCFHDDQGDVIREVLGLDQDAAFISTQQVAAPPPAVPAHSQTPQQGCGEGVGPLRNYLQKMYRQQYRCVQVLDNQVIDMFLHYLPVHLSPSSHSAGSALSLAVDGETIFDDPESSPDPHQRVLVTGEVGSGKSSLCLHTAAQWSKNLNFQQFTLVLLLNAALVISYGIKKSLLKLLRKKELQKILVPYLEETPEKCLVILDDLDLVLHHASTEMKEEVMDFLSGDIFSGCSLLATAKTNLPQKVSAKFDRQLRHPGFSIDHCHQFIRNYFKNKPEKSTSLLEFLHSFEDDRRSVDELLQRPLWLLVVCRVWELQERANVDLTLSKLYTRIERNRERERKGCQTTRRDLRQLYQLCLFCVTHKHFLLKRQDLVKISKTSIIFDFFLRRSYVSEDFEELFGYVLPQRSLLLFFAAREVGELCSDWASVWVLVNVLLGDEENADIAPFLAGLLKLPNILDLVLLHELFRPSVDLSPLKGDCVAAMTQAKKMMQDLVKESRSFLNDPSTASMEDIDIISKRKLRRKSFASDITDKNCLVARIEQMVTDVLSGICSKCLTRLFHHVLQRYHKIVALLRCQYEGLATQDDSTSLIFTKLSRCHNKHIYLGAAKKSPHDFLISELRKEDLRLEVKIPYASTLSHLNILTLYLRQVVIDQMNIQKLKILVGMGGKPNGKLTLDLCPSKSDIQKVLRESFSKLYRAGLNKISIHGLDPSTAASLLPTKHAETVDAITVGFMGRTDRWGTALSRFSHIRVDHLRFKTLELDMRSLVDLLTDHSGLLENVESFQIGHKVSLSEAAFHQLVSESEVSLMLEHPTIEEVVYHQVRLVYQPVEASRDLYIDFAEQPLPTKSLLPAGLTLNKLRIGNLHTSQNLHAILRDVCQEGVRVEDLMVSHTYMSGFILTALTEFREKLQSNIANITVRHGTYRGDEVRELLLFQSFSLCCGHELLLDAPSIDRVNLLSLSLQPHPASRGLSVHVTYPGGSEEYVSLLPASIHLHSVSLTGLAFDQPRVLQALHGDVSQCEVEELVFHFDQFMAGDAVVENLLLNVASWQRTVSRFILRNCCLHTTEMVDLLTLADVTPLSLQTVELGSIKFRHVDLQTEPLTVHIECHYPQDFTDLLPTSHRLSKITLRLFSDYSHSVSSNGSMRKADRSGAIFRPRSSRKQSTPSSVPRSVSRSHSSFSSGKSSKSYKSDENSPLSALRSSPRSNSSSKRSSLTPRRLSAISSSPSSNTSNRSVESESFLVHERSPLRELDADFENSPDFDRDHLPRTSSPLRTDSSPGSSYRGKSCHSNSHHGSSVKTDGSGRTETDGAHSLMMELEKSVCEEVTFDLASCSLETCEDLLQALTDHGDMLQQRITRLIIHHPTLPSHTLNTFSNTPLGLATKMVSTH